MDMPHLFCNVTEDDHPGYCKISYHKYGAKSHEPLSVTELASESSR